MCTLVHSIFMNIVGIAHFFWSLFVCVCVCAFIEAFVYLFCVSDICGIWSDSIKSSCSLEIEWEMLNEIQAIYSNSMLINCIYACMVPFLNAYNSSKGIRTIQPTSPSKLISIWLENFHENDFCWFALYVSPLVSFPRTSNQSPAYFSPIPWHWVDGKFTTLLHVKKRDFPNYVCTVHRI